MPGITRITISKDMFEHAINIKNELSTIFAKNTGHESFEDTQRDALFIKRLGRIIDDRILDAAPNENQINNNNAFSCEKITPNYQGKYVVENKLTMSINYAGDLTETEITFAKIFYDLLAKADRYDMLYDMKYNELKDLEEKAYDEYLKRKQTKSINEN